MEHFGGLDVSVKETSICIVDDTGMIVKEVKVASEPEALLKVLGKPGYRFKRKRPIREADIRVTRGMSA
jgi:transposase